MFPNKVRHILGIDLRPVSPLSFVDISLILKKNRVKNSNGNINITHETTLYPRLHKKFKNAHHNTANII